MSSSERSPHVFQAGRKVSTRKFLCQVDSLLIQNESFDQLGTKESIKQHKFHKNMMKCAPFDASFMQCSIDFPSNLRSVSSLLTERSVSGFDRRLLTN